jgi:hypothetical protein
VAPAPAGTGPLRLDQAWPKAKPFTLAADLPGGWSYQPFVVIDATTSVGLALSPDLAVTRIVVRSAKTSLRELQTLQGSSPPTVAAVVVVDGHIVWLETGLDDNGLFHSSLWRAELAGGPARQLAADSSEVLFYDSNFDLQVNDGLVSWAAIGAKEGGEIRSVPVDGGPETVRRLDRLYALTTFPWATTSGNGKQGDVALLNLKTDERRTVPAGPNDILSCTPMWCRVTTLINQGQSLTYDVEHTDGTARRRVGNADLVPLNGDVALGGRFEVLTSLTTNPAAAIDTSALWLYDLTNGRMVLVSEAATGGISSRGTYLWWPTGDNETLAWQVLDLRQLN